MKKRLESDLQADVLAYLQKHKIWHYRTQMGQQSGLPDIIACVLGEFVGIELKREDGTGAATKQQSKVLEDINASGGVGLLIDSLDDLKRLIEVIYEL